MMGLNYRKEVEVTLPTTDTSLPGAPRINLLGSKTLFKNIRLSNMKKEEHVLQQMRTVVISYAVGCENF